MENGKEMGGMGLLVALMVDVFKATSESLDELVTRCDGEGRTEVSIQELKYLKNEAMRRALEDENSLVKSLMSNEANG